MTRLQQGDPLLPAAPAEGANAAAVVEDFAWRGMVTELGKKIEQATVDFQTVSSNRGVQGWEPLVDYHLSLQRYRSQFQEAAIQNDRRRQIANSLFQSCRRKGQGGSASFDRLGKSLNAAEQRSMDLRADSKRFNMILDRFQQSPAHHALMNVLREQCTVSPGGHVSEKLQLPEEDFNAVLAQMKAEMNNGQKLISESSREHSDNADVHHM